VYEVNRDQSHLDIGALGDLLGSKSAALEPRETLPEDIQRHLGQCEPCRKLVEMFEDSGRDLVSLRLEKSLIRSSQCPEEGLLEELAAGIVDSARANEIIEHVIRCSRCGPMYRQISERMCLDLSSEEEDFIAQLQISMPSAQVDLARSMADSQIRVFPTRPSSSGQKEPLRIRTFLLFGLAASILVCAALVWTFRSRDAVNPSALLAQAYSEQRPFDFRLEDAPYGPVRSTRGARSSNSKPQALLEAELKIKRGLSDRPDDPTLLAAKGKAELLEFEDNEAIKDLERALALEPNSPSFLSNLALAYAQRGDQEGQTSDYEKAVGLLRRALEIDPANQVALFNKAIIDERLKSTDDAMKDWKGYLKLDDNSEWAREARAHLDKIQP
jgi:hypothetical protein